MVLFALHSFCKRPLYSVLTLSLGAFAGTAVAENGQPFYGPTQIDTAQPAIPSAQEVITDVPSAFHASRHQRGEINGLRYVLFADGSGKIMQGSDLRTVLFRIACTKGVSCDIRDRNGGLDVIQAVGGPKPPLPVAPDGSTLARYLAEWMLEGTGNTPAEPTFHVLQPESVSEVASSVIEDQILLQDTSPSSGPDIASVPLPERSPRVDAQAAPRPVPRVQPVSTQSAVWTAPTPTNRDAPVPMIAVPSDTTSKKDETFIEKIRLSCSITGSVTLRYKNHSSGSKRFGKPRTSIGCGGRLTEKLFFRVTVVGYGDKNEKSPSDADFTYAFTYRATEKITLSYSNYSARFDNPEVALSSLLDGTLRASYSLPKIKLPNKKSIGCSVSLGLPNMKEKTANLRCSYAVSKRLRISGTAYAHFPGRQKSWEPDFAYTASYRINDDWSLSYSNYANNRFFWNKSSSPGEGILGGTVSLTYKFKF